MSQEAFLVEPEYGLNSSRLLLNGGYLRREQRGIALTDLDGSWSTGLRMTMFWWWCLPTAPSNRRLDASLGREGESSPGPFDPSPELSLGPLPCAA